MKFGLLGPVVIWNAEGEPITAGQPRQCLVLAGLLSEAGRLVTAEQLISRLWDNGPPVTARRALHAHITRVRQTLVQATAPGHEPPQITHTSGGYILHVEPDHVDAHRFRDLVAQAGDPARAGQERVSLIQKAFRLWRGEPLAGLPGLWAAQTRQGWHQQRIRAAVALAGAAEEIGDVEQFLPALTDLSTEYPLAEPLAAALMRALHTTGRTQEALTHYTTTRSRLIDELGTEPGNELQRTQRAVLRSTRTPPVKVAENDTTLVPHVIGIRSGLTLPLILPADLTDTEAEHLADYIKAHANPGSNLD